MGHNTVADFRVSGTVKEVSGFGVFLIVGEGFGGGSDLDRHVPASVLLAGGGATGERWGVLEACGSAD